MRGQLSCEFYVHDVFHPGLVLSVVTLTRGWRSFSYQDFVCVAVALIYTKRNMAAQHLVSKLCIMQANEQPNPSHGVQC